MAKKHEGMIKYADPDRGYGYILLTNANDPKETIIFEAKDAVSEIEELVEGTRVTFELRNNAAQATKVEVEAAPPTA
jgi:cold shock CspA family protein